MKHHRPIISLIAAVAQNRVIGIHNQMPWHLPADLRHFKALTVGKPIVMGRKTWESLPGLLPDRLHIVVTKKPDYQAKGCKIVHSIDAALAAAGDVPEVMIVGGAALYSAMLPQADRIYLTQVETIVAGDTFFPDYDPAQWQVTAQEKHAADEKNPFPYCFLTLEHRS
ncbi:MAG: type 3 dihydrofolate reductase [Candidatus Polarisedimenticolaceae bacterium]|nr:type 3 dihydrofolate reductase [Candidatus Polarisedimenticolaceae bacterium]